MRWVRTGARGAMRFRPVVLKLDGPLAVCRSPSASHRAARARVSARAQGSEACDFKAKGFARKVRGAGRKANGVALGV